MSYDLAFWEGARPTTDDEALRLFEELFDELEDLDEDIPPTPTIEALVDELEARWPIDHPDAPWASFPLAGEAQGSALYVNLVLSVSDAVVAEVSRIAARHGVVCFDPQLESLL